MDVARRGCCPECAAPLQRYVIESEREREEGCGDLQVRGVQREREMCCKCSKYVSESEREREEGCGICKVLGVQRERDRDAL